MQTRFGPVLAALSVVALCSALPVTRAGRSRSWHSYVWRACLATRFCASAPCQPRCPKGGTHCSGRGWKLRFAQSAYPEKATPPGSCNISLMRGLMGRSWDEPFALYGLLAESIEVD